MNDLTTISSQPSFDVAERDPLGLDGTFRDLPQHNRCGDTVWILAQLEAALPPGLATAAAAMDLRDALAVVRDLGILAASLRRHGLEVHEASPRMEQALLALGACTGMVPRDTVFHYGPWNPRGIRERTFTGDPDERALIESTRIASPRIEQAVQHCLALTHVPLESEVFARTAQEAAADLDGLIAGIMVARQGVDPHYFAQTLRPYFEAITIGGTLYAGSAAAPLSVGMVDHLLWSSDCNDPQFRSFHEHSMLYNVPSMMRLYHERLGQPSLVSHFCQQEATDPEALLRSAHGLDAMLAQLLRFRGGHVVLARAAYNDQIRKYAVGSAGYGINTLQHLQQLTKQARQRLGADVSELEECSM